MKIEKEQSRDGIVYSVSNFRKWNRTPPHSMDTFGTNNMLVQTTKRTPRRRVRIRDKGSRPDSAVSGLEENAELCVLFFPGHGSLQQVNYSKERFLRRYKSTTKRIMVRFKTTFYPNPLLHLFRRLWHTGRRGRERRDRKLQQNDQRVHYQTRISPSSVRVWHIRVW